MGRPRKIDLSLYDTIKKGERRAVVIAITPAAIVAKENTERYQTESQKLKRITIRRDAYADGSSGWVRVNLPRVTVSHVGGNNDKACKGKAEAEECGKGR